MSKKLFVKSIPECENELKIGGQVNVGRIGRSPLDSGIYVKSSNLRVWGCCFWDWKNFRGRDARYYYLGNFEVEYGGLVKADVRVTHFTGEPYSIFGSREEFRLSVSGKLNFPVMELTGHVVGEPHLVLALRLTWRAPLP